MPLGNSFGYPVATADELGLTDYFRKNPKVAGMAWGGGMNGSPVDSPRVIVANPFNAQIAKPEKMQGLLKIEAARHLMDETGYTPEFEISEEQQEWRKTLGKYATDDLAVKQSIVSRIMVNDDVDGVTPEQRADAMRFNEILDERENPSFIKTIIKNIEESTGVPRPWELTPGTSIAKELVAGEDGDELREKVRKGAAKFVGRVVTNVKKPVGYTTSGEDDLNPFPHMKAILKDDPHWLQPGSPALIWKGVPTISNENIKARDILYRDLFDLPARVQSKAIERTSDKEYKIANSNSEPIPKDWQNQEKQSALGHGIMGGVALTPTGDGGFTYSDVWDLVSPGDKKRAEEGDTVTALRIALAPYLRPATIKGKISPGNQILVRKKKSE